MPPPVSYEVQVFGGGKWTTELVLTDRQEAEDEALRTLDSSRRPLGVRVVREEVDEKTSLITATTVFRRTREDDRSADEKEDKRQQMKAKLAEIRVERRQAARSQPSPAAAPAVKTAAEPRQGFHWTWLIILFIALIIAGLVTLLKLHSLFLG